MEGKRIPPGASRRPLSEPARQALRRAVALHQAGRLREARQAYEVVLKEQPDNFDAVHLIGVLASHMHKPAEARKWLAEAVAISPDNPAAHTHLGNALQELDRSTDALASYDRAIALNPGFFQAHVNRGRCLRALGRPEMALASYEAAIRLQPTSADAHDGRGSALGDLGRREEALASHDRAIALRPDFAEAYNNRGVALKVLGRFDEAIVAYDRAIGLKPDFALAHDNRGAALAALDRLEEAIANHDRAIALDARFASAHYNRGKSLEGLGRFDEAIRAYDRATESNPGFAEAHNNRGAALAERKRWAEALASYDKAIALDRKAYQPHFNRGNALKALRRYDDADAAYRRAIALEPDHAEAHCGRGDALNALERHDEAARCYARALEIDPHHPFTKGLRLHQKLLCCDWEETTDLIGEIERDIERGKPSAEPFCWQGVSTSPRGLQACARIFSATRFPGGGAPHPAPAAAPDGKIRIGYVSGEFRAQATSYLLAGVLERHDKTRFEVHAFDNGWDDQSDTRERVNAAVTEIVDIDRLDDRAAAQAIRDRGIDILIDLNGYFGLHRTGIFALRPAPIQVNYLGFPATLGAGYLDYIIADAIVIPESHRNFYDERVAYLPGCYQANDARRAIDAAPVSRREHGLPEEGMVFCCFNNPYKILPETFDGWMRILKRAPGSVLWLLAGNFAATINLRKEAERRDVDPARLIFAERRPVAEHLARLRLADLVLDTLPYNAHTTASDALWAGVPVLTQMGETFPGRVAASLLEAVGLSELIASSREDYETLAVELATHPERLAALREKLARLRLTAPLFDTALYTRRLEAAYAAMHERHRSGLPPDHFQVGT